MSKIEPEDRNMEQTDSCKRVGGGGNWVTVRGLLEEHT